MKEHKKECIDYNDNLFPTRLVIPCICNDLKLIEVLKND
jgi:hypothetical protein